MTSDSEDCFNSSSLVEYSEETTFHGIKYVFKPKQNIFQRAFWILILPTLFFALGYFVHISVSRFVQFSVKTQENTHFTYIYKIPFAAITICPANKIHNFSVASQATFAELFKFAESSDDTVWQTDTLSKFIMATQICRKPFALSFRNIIQALSKNPVKNLTIPTELSFETINKLFEMSPALLETIRECQLANWHERELAVMSNENVEQLFSKIITNEGLCFTFNTVSDVLRPIELSKFFYEGYYSRDGWDPDTGYTKHKAFPFKAIVRGNDQQNGLRVILSENVTQRTEYCSPSNLGYKLILHSPSEYPHGYENFISLEYGKDYTIAVKPETISTAKSLRSISPALRQCYFNDERQLKYYTFYNKNNCQLECYANYSLKMFKGFPFSAPRDNNTPVCVLKSYNYGWHLPKYFSSTYVYNKLYNSSLHSNVTMDMDCNCLPECNSIRYDYKIVDENANVLDSDRLVNISETTLEIMFDQPKFIGKERVREYTFAALVSDFGGLLGLFMGGSLISIFELFYFLLIHKFK